MGVGLITCLVAKGRCLSSRVSTVEWYGRGCSTDMAQKCKKTKAPMWASTITDKRRDVVCMNGLIRAGIVASGSGTSHTASEYITGRMEECIRANGSTEIAMELANIPGPIKRSTSVSTMRKTRKALEFTDGLMGAPTRATGRMAVKPVLGRSTSPARQGSPRPSSASGSKANERERSRWTKKMPANWWPSCKQPKSNCYKKTSSSSDT